MSCANDNRLHQTAMLYGIVMDVPMSESAPKFGDKVPCTKCGQVGCRWKGSA